MKGKRSPYGPDLRGFTLLEILLAFFILSIVLTTVFASYTGTFRIVGEIESQAEIYEMARIALGRMVDDLGSVRLPPEALGPAELEEEKAEVPFEGEEKEIDGNRADSLTFSSSAHLVFGEQDLPSGIAQISYYTEEVEDEETLVLYRRDRSQLEESNEEEGGGVPLCEKLVSVGFTYYDRDGEEYKSWESSMNEGLPQRVSIALEFAHPSNAETPLKFVTSVALGMAGMKG